MKGEGTDSQTDGKANVLLIDDRLDILTALGAILKSPTLNLVPVQSGQAALEALEEQEFALALLDVEMPGMNGFETARIIREKEHSRHLPIIFVTAASDQRDFVFEGYATGAVDVIFKPFEPSILVSKVSAFVNIYRHERSLKQAILSQLEAKDRFLAQISHELRTPLNALSQFLEIVESGLSGELNDEQQEFLGISLRNARSLDVLISDLLDVVRAQNNKLSVVPQEVALSDIVEELVPIVMGSARAKRIEVSVELSETLPDLWADPARIRQVILNLAGNAIKFGAAGMPLMLTAGVSDANPDMVQIDVRDEGPGIDPAKAIAIFDPLHQEVDRLEDTSRQGLGLGLYICKELVSQHGGHIWVDAAAGEGCTFSFTVPRSDSGAGVKHRNHAAAGIADVPHGSSAKPWGDSGRTPPIHSDRPAKLAGSDSPTKLMKLTKLP